MPDTPEQLTTTRREFLYGASALAGACAVGGALGAFGIRTALGQLLPSSREVVDDLGRTVEIPAPSRLSRVYFSGPIAQIMLYSLKPEVIGGTTLPFTPKELSMLPPEQARLPFMGSLSEGDGTFDVEALHEEGIQLILAATGDDRSVESLDDPDAFQEELGIPVLCLDAGFDSMGAAYRTMGAIVGAERRAAELADYCEGILAKVQSGLERLPVEKRVHLYYAEGPDGLRTEPFTSAHAHTFGVAGAYNVADFETHDSAGQTHVTLDQVREWDPEVIVAWDYEVRNGADQLIRESDEWRGISAVDNGRVYTMPNTPFSWCDRPAGPNRCIGIQWIANLLYPDYYDVDMIETVREFYEVMWRLEIDERQARQLLGK